MGGEGRRERKGEMYRGKEPRKGGNDAEFFPGNEWTVDIEIQSCNLNQCAWFHTLFRHLEPTALLLCRPHFKSDILPDNDQTMNTSNSAQSPAATICPSRRTASTRCRSRQSFDPNASQEYLAASGCAQLCRHRSMV